MTPGLRGFALGAHVACSVGWFGSALAFLALAVVGLTSQDAQTVRSAYLATELLTWSVIVPLSLASLLTGPRWSCCSRPPRWRSTSRVD